MLDGNHEQYASLLSEALNEIKKPRKEWNHIVFQRVCAAACIAKSTDDCCTKLAIGKSIFDKITKWRKGNSTDFFSIVKCAADTSQSGGEVSSEKKLVATTSEALKTPEVTPMAIHPLADLFPPMNTDELAALTDSIRLNGQHDPVVILEGQILDGRHRMKSLTELKITPVTIDFSEFNLSCTPLEWVLDKNLRRRHLDESQRAMIASKLKDELTAENSPPGRKAVYVGKMMAVSDFSVKLADRVRKNAVAELAELVTSGAVSVSAAAEVSGLNQDQQKALVKQGSKVLTEKAGRLRDARKAESSSKKGGNRSRTKGPIKTGAATAPPIVVERAGSQKYRVELSRENYQPEMAALLADSAQFVGWVNAGLLFNFKGGAE